MKAKHITEATKLKESQALMTLADCDGVRHDVVTNLHILILKLIWK